MFQLTPPRGGDYADIVQAIHEIQFQLTPPRGGDLDEDEDEEIPYIVSTHAPARGRPRAGRSERKECGVSTHAPARGRLSDRPPRNLRPPGFNSRPREGAT